MTGIRLGAHTPIPSHPRFGLTTFVKGVPIAYRAKGVWLLTQPVYLSAPTFNSHLIPPDSQLTMQLPLLAEIVRFAIKCLHI